MGKRVDLFGHDWSTDEGLGDTVSRVIKKVSKGKIKECGGCQKRRDILNRMVPYSRGDNQKKR
jgi:hypothetical protein